MLTVIFRTLFILFTFQFTSTYLETPIAIVLTALIASNLYLFEIVYAQSKHIHFITKHMVRVDLEKFRAISK